MLDVALLGQIYGYQICLVMKFQVLGISTLFEYVGWLASLFENKINIKKTFKLKSVKTVDVDWFLSFQWDTWTYVSITSFVSSGGNCIL